MCITRQRAIDATRSQVHGSRAREALLIEHILADTGGDRSGLILQQSVRAALADLSQQQRQALDLAYYGGRTERQIAECLGTPIGTVKSHLRVALLKLRDSLARIDAH